VQARHHLFLRRQHTSLDCAIVAKLDDKPDADTHLLAFEATFKAISRHSFQTKAAIVEYSLLSYFEDKASSNNPDYPHSLLNCPPSIIPHNLQSFSSLQEYMGEVA
jgi:hypothetical protein